MQNTVNSKTGALFAETVEMDYGTSLYQGTSTYYIASPSKNIYKKGYTAVGVSLVHAGAAHINVFGLYISNNGLYAHVYSGTSAYSGILTACVLYEKN